MTDELSPSMCALYEKYKQEHPQEVAQAHRTAREIAFKCTGVLHSYEGSMVHVVECKKCAPALGLIAMDLAVPKASD